MKIQNPKSKIKKFRPAFTLVELLMVIAIIMLLAGLLLPALIAARNYARVNKARSETRDLAKAWEAYWDAYKQWPTVSDMDSGAVAILQGRNHPENTNDIMFMSFSRRAETQGFRDPWGELYRVQLSQREIQRDTWFRTRVHMANRHRYR